MEELDKMNWPRMIKSGRVIRDLNIINCFSEATQQL